MSAEKHPLSIDISKIRNFQNKNSHFSGEHGRRRSRSLGGYVPGRTEDGLGSGMDLEEPSFDSVREEANGRGMDSQRALSARCSDDERRSEKKLSRKKYFDGRGVVLHMDSVGLDHPSQEDVRNGYNSNGGGYSTSGVKRRITRRYARRKSIIGGPDKHTKNEVEKHACESLPEDERFRRRTETTRCAGVFSKRTPEFKHKRTLSTTKVTLKDLPPLSDMNAFDLLSEKNDYVEGNIGMSGHDCLFRCVSFCLMCLNPIFAINSWNNIEAGEHLEVARACRELIAEEASEYLKTNIPFVEDTKQGTVLKEWYAGKGHAELPSVYLTRFMQFSNGVGDMIYSTEEHRAILQAVATKYNACVTILYSVVDEKKAAKNGLPKGVGGMHIFWPRFKAGVKSLKRVSLFYDFKHFYPVRPRGDAGGYRNKTKDQDPQLCKVDSAAMAEKEAVDLIKKYPFEIISYNIENMSTLGCGKFERSTFSRSIYVCPTLGVRTGCDNAKHFYTVRRLRANIPENCKWNKNLHKMYVVLFNRRKQSMCVGYMTNSKDNMEKNYLDSTRFHLSKPMRMLVLVCAASLELAELVVSEKKEELALQLAYFHARK